MGRKQYTIVASREELKNVGIDMDLTGQSCCILKDFNDGYVQINKGFVGHHFHVPKVFLKEIEK